jgi:hypothetical protein
MIAAAPTIGGTLVSEQENLIYHHKTAHRQGGKNHVLLFAESSQKKRTVCGIC